MELSENVKLRLDTPVGESLEERLLRDLEQTATAEAGRNDEAESQMRRALGLLGESPRHRPDADRQEQQGRSGGGFNGGLHRRRFVQDGDIPVTVLRREPGLDAAPYRAAAPVTGPTSSRLQRTEAALAAETAAREKADRALGESYAVVRDLQTKIGHAELAKTEAVDALRHEREIVAQLRTDAESWETRLQEVRDQAEAAENAASGYQDQYEEERQARKAAEKALRSVEAARDAAELLVKTLSEEATNRGRSAPQASEPVYAEPKRNEPARRAKVIAEPLLVETPARRNRGAEVAAVEQEPVKWWLNAKPTGKRR
jgi:DNA repair exonuclease SbcCD ATPase subunit